MRTGSALAALATASIIVAAGLATPLAAQQPSFRARTYAIQVDALVTDHGRTVTGLTADDFEVLDNGVRQKIALATTSGPVTIALVLDTSGSVEGDKFRSLVVAAERLVDALRPGDVVSLVTFSERLSLRVAQARDPSAVRAALGAARTRGLTAMWDGLFAGLSVVSADAGRSLVLLMTDAGDNSSYLTDEQLVEAVRRSNAVVDVVIAGRPTGLIDWLQPLRGIARESGGQFLIADWHKQLPQAFVDALDEFRARYLLTYEPTGVGRAAGWHTLQVRLKNKSGKVQARPGYYATAR